MCDAVIQLIILGECHELAACCCALQEPNAGSDDGVLFEKGPGISRIWHQHPDGSLSTVLSVTPSIQPSLPIRSESFAAASSQPCIRRLVACILFQA